MRQMRRIRHRGSGSSRRLRQVKTCTYRISIIDSLRSDTLAGAMNYAPYPGRGTLGLGALTYPSWIPQTCVNCSASTLERWKTQMAFAMGWYDIFRNLEKFPDPAQAERFKRFGTYGKPELAMDPNNAFWSSTPERLADHADIVKQALRHGSFHTSTSFTPGKAIADAAKAVVNSPVMALVNPTDALVHKIVGDKVYYGIAKAIGGDKVEAALKAGNHSLADLSKGKTRAELVSQGIEVAKVAVQEKLTPEQVNAVLASLPPDTAQAARDALAGKPSSAGAQATPATPAPAQLRTLDPPKRPTAAAPAAPTATPLRTLDPPKRTPAPPQKTTAAMPPSTPPVQASAVAPGAFVYAPYPKMGALSGPPPDCISLGPPITDMDGGMRHAGLSAVNGSRGRSRMVAGPDGKDYLFALEGGALVARQCFSEAGLSGPGFKYAPYALNAPPPPHGGHGGGHGHSGGGDRHFSHGGSRAGRGGRGWWGGGPWNYVTAIQTCRTWGDPIMMFSEMATAAQQALNASGGRPTTVRGPDGVLYLFAIENGAYTARTCAAT